MEKINEGKEIYRNPYYGDQEYYENNNNNNTMQFIYDCGHSLSSNMKGGGPPRKINGPCQGCLAQQQGKGSGNKWNMGKTKG